MKEKQMNLELDCSINRFTSCGIEEPEAIVLLNHLHYCIDRKEQKVFSFKLITEKVFSEKTNGSEKGKINNSFRSVTWEPAKKIEDGGICLSFLFFSNALSIKTWMAVPRRGEGYDYICQDKNGKKLVVEVCGKSSKYGAKAGLREKKERFVTVGCPQEPTYISSVGFKDGEHIVYKYN